MRPIFARISITPSSSLSFRFLRTLSLRYDLSYCPDRPLPSDVRPINYNRLIPIFSLGAGTLARYLQRH